MSPGDIGDEKKGSGDGEEGKQPDEHIPNPPVENAEGEADPAYMAVDSDSRLVYVHRDVGTRETFEAHFGRHIEDNNEEADEAVQNDPRREESARVAAPPPHAGITIDYEGEDVAPVELVEEDAQDLDAPVELLEEDAQDDEAALDELAETRADNAQLQAQIDALRNQAPQGGPRRFTR